MTLGYSIKDGENGAKTFVFHGFMEREALEKIAQAADCAVHWDPTRRTGVVHNGIRVNDGIGRVVTDGASTSLELSGHKTIEKITDYLKLSEGYFRAHNY